MYSAVEAATPALRAEPWPPFSLSRMRNGKRAASASRLARSSGREPSLTTMTSLAGIDCANTLATERSMKAEPL